MHVSHIRDVQSGENLVEQWGVSAGTGDVECIEDSVLEDVRLVEFDWRPKLGAFISDVTHLESQIPSKIVLNGKIHVLAVLNPSIIGKATKRGRPVRERHRIVWPGASRRKGHEAGSRACDVEISRWRVNYLNLRPRLGADFASVLLVSRSAGVINPISSPNHRTEPRKRPTETYRRRE